MIPLFFSRKKTAYFLTAAMMLSCFTASPAYPAETGETEINEVSAELLQEAAELCSLESGSDYVESEGVFLCDDLTEARKTAESYGAVLTSFEQGIAKVSFNGSTRQALINAAENEDVDRIIEPNYLYYIDDDILPETTPVQDPFSLSSSPSYQYYHDKIKDREAFSTSSGNGVKVAVIDTGVNPYHEDLIGRVSVNCISRYKGSLNGIDIKGHGTHVAGIIASGMDNGLGGYGVAPGAFVESIQISDTGAGFTMDAAAEGLRIAINKNVQVINMSIGSVNKSKVLQALIDEAYSKGIVCVASAGNGVKKGGISYGVSDKNFPAAGEHCIAVAATTSDDQLARYSNYGNWVDIAAPGSGIYSTFIGSLGAMGGEDSYTSLNGTSQAAPMVSAVAALCYAANPYFIEHKDGGTAGLIEEIIRTSNDGKEYSYNGHSVKTGLVRADKAVKTASSFTFSSSYSIMDGAGHFGPVLFGGLCKKSSVKLRVADDNGNPLDKIKMKSVIWTSGDPSKVTVKNGKIKCSDTAEKGDLITITAEIGGERLYYVVTVEDRVKKLGAYNSAEDKIRTSYSREISKGETMDIGSPYSLVNDGEAYVFYSTKKNYLTGNFTKYTSVANSQFTYDIMISKKDLGKITVNSTDSNGDPLNVTFREKGKLTIKYRLLDGSGKKMKCTLFIR